MTDIDDILKQIPEEEILAFLREKAEEQNQVPVPEVIDYDPLVDSKDFFVGGRDLCALCGRSLTIDKLKTLEHWGIKLTKSQLDKLALKEVEE